MTKPILTKPQNRKPKTAHDALIKEMGGHYPNAFEGGFKSSVRALQKRIGVFSDEIWKGGFIPDLWFIDEECMSLVCLEVEDSSRLSAYKLEEYRRLWFTFDCYHWETHLISISRWGAPAALPLFLVSQPEEKDKNLTMFALSKIYCIQNKEERNAARSRWMLENPEFLKSAFYRQERIERRLAKGPYIPAITVA